MDWAELDIPTADFDVAALAAALEARKAERGLSWKAVAAEVNRSHLPRAIRPISASTIAGLAGKRSAVEGDGVLQMLLWLGRTPESFVPGHPGADLPEARLPAPGPSQVVRFDVPKIHAALDAGRLARGMSWGDMAGEIDGLCSAGSLSRMGQNGRASFPWVMRLTRWLRSPAAAYTRLASW